MSIRRHGLTIGIERVETRLLVSFKAYGKLTHLDYQAITPMIESAFAEVHHPQVRVLFDARELEGWDLRAAWDDLKLGLKHGQEFEKLAILGQQPWLEWAAKVGKWFMAGEIDIFEDEQAALTWLES